MRIVVNDQVHLSEFRSSDKPALIEHLNDRDIYDRTLRIPFPYTDANADAFLALVAKTTEKQGQPVYFAIRSADDALIGGCGLNGFEIGKSHRAEVGYWLAKPFWCRGIMTAVLQRVCQHAFAEFGLVKIIAHVSTLNPASARVLEKCGFVQEGLLRKQFAKDGQFIDAWMFALLKWASEYIVRLQNGETVQLRPKGNSMQGKIESGQLCTVEPVVPATFKVGDIVLCKVNGKQYLHLVKAIQGKRFQIGNNRGRINGWVGENSIFGKCTRIE